MADFDTEFASFRGSKAPAEGVTFDDEFSAYRQSKERDTAALRTSVDAALQTTPVQAARVKYLATTTGIDPSVVATQEGEVAARAKLQEIQKEAQFSPVLQARLRDPEFTKLAIDDVPTLSKLEKSLRGLFDTSNRRLKPYDSKEMYRNTAQRFDLMTDQDMQDMKYGVAKGWVGPAPTAENIVTGLAKAFPQALETVRTGASLQMGDALEALGLLKYTPQEKEEQLKRVQRAQGASAFTTPDFQTSTGEGLYSGGLSLVNNSVGLTAAVLTRNPNLALWTIGAQTNANAYGKYRARGGTPGEATLGAGLEAGIEVGTEMLPMKVLTDKLGRVGMGHFLKEFLGKETISEQLATIGQDAVDTAIANPDKTWGEYLAERPGAAYQTFLATLVQAGVMGGANHVLGKIQHEQKQAYQEAQDRATQMQDVMATAAGSKLRELSPDTFREHVQAAADGQEGAPKSVHIDGQVLLQTLQAAGVTEEQLAKSLPSVVPQLAEAATANSTVEIPIGELATALPGTPLEQALLPHLRIGGPESLSQSEAEQAQKQAQEFLKTEAQRVVQTAQDQVQWTQEAEGIKANIRSQLAATGRFSDDVNAKYATLVQDFYSVMASRTGMTPKAMYDLMPYKVGVRGQGGAVLDTMRQGSVANPRALPVVAKGAKVDGRVVRDHVPNLDSIDSSFDNAEILEGVREVPLSAFDSSYLDSVSMGKLDARTRKRAEDIKASGEINPLIVAFDSKGAYIVEGGHRFDALIASGAKSVPAVVVIDHSDPPELHQSPIGDKLMARVQNDFPALVQEYKALPETNGGQIINTDMARELSPEYRADRTRSAEVHDAASALMSNLYAERLAQPVQPGRSPSVLFTAGGTGAGKSSGLDMMPDLAKQSDIIYDGTMSKLKGAVEKIEQALASGRSVNYMYVYREPGEALQNGALPRAMKSGRTAPLQVLQDSHTGARAVAEALAEKYAGNPRVNFIFIDNSHGFGNAKVVALANIPQVPDNGLKEKLNDILDQEHQAGNISDAVYAGTKGLDGRLAGTAGNDSGGVHAEAGAAVRGRAEQGGSGLTDQGLNQAPNKYQTRYLAGRDLASLDAEQRAQYDILATPSDRLQQPEAQGPRGTFNPSTLTTVLNENADLSTFLHETGHFFLEAMATLASQPNADASVAKDMGALLKWFGIMGNEDVGGAQGGTPLEQPAYHGTPHRGIDKFSTDKIGTGEGNQAFGWGLYFASKKEVAEYYRKTLTSNSGPANDVANYWLDQAKGDKPKALELLKAYAADAGLPDADIADAVAVLSSARGQLYEVDIPEDSEMLLFDKPITSQPDAVKKILKDSGLWKELRDNLNDFAAPMNTRGKLNGENIYNYLEWKLGSDKAASLRLLELGIKGTKYPGGTIAGVKNAGYNYVVFSGDDVAVKNQFYQGGESSDAQPVQPKRTPLETWNSMTLEQQRQHHERFAESFELYLMEGKSPNIELASLFRTFRAWLTRVYKSLSGFMEGRDLKFSDDIRQVMDRMLATEAQIAEAEKVAGLVPELDATGEAIEQLQSRSIRDLKWAVNARNKFIKQLQQEAKAKRKEVQAEVTAEVDAMPEFAAKKALDDLRKATKEKPSDADLSAIADAHGFKDYATMLTAIDAIGKKADVIEGMTDQRMLERYGDLVDQSSIEQAATEAVHNAARAKSLATELAAQRELLNPRQDTGKTNVNGQKITVNALVEAAKQFAANVVGGKPVGDLKKAAYNHLQAERRAAKAWEAATAKGDTQAAVQAKQDQMLNNAAVRAANEAIDDAKKTMEFFAKVLKGNSETVVEKGRDPDIVNAARAILAVYGVGTFQGKNAFEYMDLLKANDPSLFAIMDDAVRAAVANAKPVSKLTVDELSALKDEIASMWHLAKSSRQYEVDGDRMSIEDAAEELKARMEAKGVPSVMPGDFGAVTEAEKRGRSLQFAGALLRRVESWAEGMDGKFGGPFLKLVFQPVKAAADSYRADRAAYRKQFTALVENVAPALKPGLIEAPELGYTFGKGKGGVGQAELLSALLHLGNESNKRKLLLGRNWATENQDGTLDTSRWDAFMARMHNVGAINKAHYDFAQGVWDLLEKMKPLAQKTHRDVYGRYFAEVTANTLDTPFGPYKGGYVPAQVDPEIVKDNELRKLAEVENENMSYAFPATNKGFTKGRTEYNRPLMLDLRTLPQHIDKVLLFSHMEPAVRGVSKVLGQRGVASMLGKIDPAAIGGMLTPWLNRSARQIVETPVVGDGRISRVLSVIRARAGMSVMFANVSNTVQQLAGLTLAGVKVKPSYLASAMAQYTRNPKKTSEAVAAASKFMATRADDQIAALTGITNDILLNPSVYEKAQNWTAKHTYFLQSALDNVVGPIVWSAAYNQAIEQGMKESDAVHFADGTVRQTQGSTLPEDVSRIETGPAYARIFTQFLGYFNMVANTNVTALQNISDDVGLKKGAGKALAVLFFGLLAPAWIAEAIAVAFKGGPDDEDKDGSYLDDWLMAVFGMGTLKTVLAGVPFVGQFAMAGVNTWNSKPYDDRTNLSPAVSMLEGSVGAPHSVYKALVDNGSKQKAVRDVATAISLLTGLPVSAAARPLGYLTGVAESKVNPTGPVDAARGVVTGTASPESKR